MTTPTKTNPSAKTSAATRPARAPRPIKLGDRVVGKTSRGNEVRGKVVEILRRATGPYVGVQPGRGERIRYTRPSQLSRV